MQRLKHELTGHAIGQESLLHEGVHGFDHHAARERTVFVSHLDTALSINFSGPTEFSFQAPFSVRHHARSQKPEVQLKATG